MTLMSRDRALVERNRDAADRLADAMGEVKRLEGSLAGFLSGELPELKRAIDDLSRNQAVFTSYARSGGTKHKPETLETTA
jgi:hypothetical protein